MQTPNARAALSNAYDLLTADDGENESDSDSDTTSSDESQVFSRGGKDFDGSSQTSASSGKSVADKLTAHARKVLANAPSTLIDNVRCRAHQKRCECFWNYEPDQTMAQEVTLKMSKILLTTEVS